jgi:hypothetical protein
MTPEDFLAGLTGSRDDFRLATEALRACGQPFCLIGGLAINHYVEPVVTLEDLVQGKLWALQDPSRRASKQAKDEADLIRICESYPSIIKAVPVGLIQRIDSMRT